MHSRALSLIEHLDLKVHPEGGYFREVFRSSSLVTVSPSAAQRTTVTSIYYLLPGGQVSKLHRAGADEVWHFLEGDPLELYTLDPGLTALRTHLLGPVSGKAQPIHAVPANEWQAAMSKGAFTLAGCTTGPGFEYADFALLADDAELAKAARVKFPAVARFL